MNSLPTKSPRKWATAAAAACAAGLAIVPSSHADITAPGFTQAGVGATDWTLNRDAANPAGIPSITTNVLTLTTNANSEASSAWFNTAQSLSNFTAQFTYNFVNGSAPPADGFTFALQNDSLTAIGGGGGALGYVGNSLLGSANDHSVALAFDLWNNQNQANPRVTRTGFSATGYGGIMYQESDPFDPTKIVLSDPAPITVKIDYRDGVFTRTLTQGANTVVKTQNLNLADRIGSSAFVGFTGGTGGANATQTFSNFSYTTGGAPAVAPAAQALTGVPTGGPGAWGIREIQSGTALNNLTDALGAVSGGGTSHVDYTAPIVNLQDTGGHGNFLNDSLYKIDPDQAGVDTDTVNNVAVVATGTVRIPTTGMYTFGVNSDDGFRLTIGGQRFEGAFGQAGTSIDANGSLQFTAGRGVDNSLGTIFLKAGDYPIQMVNWEGGGGAAVELYASPGAKTGYDPSTFNLVGGPLIAGTTGKNKVQTVSNWTYEPYTNAANVTQVIDKHFGINNSPAVLGTVATVPTIRFSDPQNANNGSHAADRADFPGNTAGDDDNFGGFAQATLTLAAGDIGTYTFLMYADDDSRFRILLGDAATGVPVPLLGIAGTGVEQFDSDGVNGNDMFGTTGCCNDLYGKYNLSQAGIYTIQAAFHEGGGGSGFFLYGTQGDRSTFDPNAFQLLGANVNGSTWDTNVPAGLQLVPEPTSMTLLGLAAVGLMARRLRQS
jgi:hypothetical protein